MGYKILGFAVWQVAKWYARRRLNQVDRKIAVAGVGGLVVAGLLIGGAVAAKRRPDDEP